MAYTTDLVEEQFDLMQTIAKEFVDKASVLQESLEASIIALEVPGYEDPIVTIPSPTKITQVTTAAPDSPDLPEVPTVSIGNIPKPGEISYDNLSYTDPTEPTLTEISAPTSNFPNAPSSANISLQTYTPLSAPKAPDEPILNSISLPAAPSFDFPTEPILAELVFPSMPGIATISFDGTKPNDADISAPENFTYDMTIFQHSDLWNAVVSKVETDLVNGATGLDADIEAAIFQRHQDRQQVANDQLYQEAESMYGASGFNLPTGAMVARLSELKAEIARKDDDVSLDIMIKQAELAQNNSQFAIEKGIQIGQILQGFYIQSEELTFRIAVETQNKAMEIFNAKVAFYNLKLDGYKTDLQVYTARLQGELTKVETYKSEVTAVGIQADAQKNQVEVYAQKMAALDITSKIYVTQLEGSKTELSLEALKIDSYKSLVDAYATEMQAESINVDAFKARIEAENTKVAQYAAEVDAYRGAIAAESARLQSLLDIERLGIESDTLDVEKYKANIQAAISKLQAQTSVISAKTEIYNAESNRYNSLVSAQATASQAESSNYSVKVQGLSENYRNETTQYTAEVSAKQDYNRTLLAEMQTGIQYASDLIGAYNQKLEIISNAYLKIKDLQISGETGTMNAATQLAASAMNAVNASASQSAGYTSSESSQTSDSFTETHTYSH